MEVIVKSETAEFLTVCMAAEKHSVHELTSRQNDEWCDVLLFGSDSPVSGIRAHRTVLTSASSHFRDAFSCKAFLISGAKEYRLEKIHHTILQIIVDFIYSNELRLAGGSLEIQAELVLIAADYLHMSELKSICGHILADPSRHLDSCSAVNKWLFARKYHCQVLEDAALHAIATDVGAVADQDDYLRLDNKDAVALLKALASVTPAVVPDLSCEAAIAWLGWNAQDRKGDCDEIMRQVALEEISADMLRQASAKDFLSGSMLYAVKAALALRVKVDGLQADKLSLTDELVTLTDELETTNTLAETQRFHLNQMLSQATELEEAEKRWQGWHRHTCEQNYAWFDKGEAARDKKRKAAQSFIENQT